MATRGVVPSYAGRLELVVVSAHELAAKEGKVDPYCNISVFAASKPALPEHEGKTRTVKKSSEPVWDESFAFDFGSAQSNDHQLRLEVWDWNQIMRDKFLGQADLSLVPGERLQKGEQVELDLPLVPREASGGKPSKKPVTGFIKVKAKLAEDYHQARAEAAAKAKEEAEEQEKRTAELVGQVRLTRTAAEKLIETFRNCVAGRKGISMGDFYTVFRDMDPETKRALEGQVSDYRDLFQRLDVNHDGSLDLEELLFGISTLATGSLDDKAELVFKAMDNDGSGSLDREEVKQQFEKLLKVLCEYIKKAVSDLAIRKYGQTLPNETLQTMLDTVSQPLKAKLTGEAVDRIFRLGDTDKDGQLSLDEWRQLVKREESAQWLVNPDLYVSQVKAQVRPKLEAIFK